MEGNVQKRKTYTKDYKLKAVRMYDEGMGIKSIAKKLGFMDHKTVRTWIRKYQDFGETAFDPNVKAIKKPVHKAKRGRPEKDKKSLKERVKRLEIENEILKKTAEFFKELDRKGTK